MIFSMSCLLASLCNQNSGLDINLLGSFVLAQGHVEWLNLDPVPIKIKASFDFNSIGRDLSKTAGSVW